MHTYVKQTNTLLKLWNQLRHL